jgi:Na+/melibiose symporter-like transporter
MALSAIPLLLYNLTEQEAKRMHNELEARRNVKEALA